GHLEFEAQRQARLMLKDGGEASARLLELALGPSLGQCCGGRATLLIETLGPPARSWLQAWQAPHAHALMRTCVQPYEKALITKGGESSFVDAQQVLKSAGASTLLINRGGPSPCYLVEIMRDPRRDLFLCCAGHV